MFWGLSLLVLGLVGLFASLRMDHQRDALALPDACLASDVSWRSGGMAADDEPWVRFDAVPPRCVGAVALIDYRRGDVVVQQSVVRLGPGVTDRGPVPTTDVTWGVLSSG